MPGDDTTEPPREPPCEPPREPPRELLREPPREPLREPPREPLREPLRVRLDLPPDAHDEGVIRFLKRPDDHVRRDEPVAELDIGKVCIELTAPEDGFIATSRGDGDVRIGDDLYTLRPGPPPPPAPPKPPPIAGPAPPATLPRVLQIQTTWHVGPLLAAAARHADAAPAHSEAALVCTAVLRALVAVPALFTTLVEPAISGRIPLRYCDVRPSATLWSHAHLGPADDPAQILAALTAGPGVPPRVTIVRLHGAAPLAMIPHPGSGLVVTIGPVAPQPVVEADAVVIRPVSTLCLGVQPWLTADVAATLCNALVEQLAVL